MNRRSSYMIILTIGLVLVAGLVSALWMRRSYRQMENLEAKQISLIAEKGALAEEISALTTELKGRDKEIKNLRTRIQRLGIDAEQFAKSQQQLLDQRVDQFMAERTRMAARLKEIETKAADLREAKERAEQTIERQQKSISSIKEEIASGQIKIAQLAEMGEALRETKIKREQIISELESQQQLLEDRVDQFMAERTRMAARLKEIETKAVDLREAKERAERTMESQQRSFSSMKEEIGSGQIKIAQLTEMGETLRETKIKREQTISELVRKHQQMVGQLDKAMGDKFKLNKIIESHQRQGEKYQERLTELSQISHNLQQRMKTFLADVHNTRAYTQKLMIEKAQLIDRIKETETGARELTVAMEEAKRTVQIQQQLIASLKQEIATGQVKITQFASRTTIHLKDNILFDSGEASIKPSGVAVLKKIGKTLKTIRDKRIQVEGHTDSRPLRWEYREKYPTNWELSAARAAIIVRYLIDDVGIDATRLSAVGYGLYQPVASNDSPEGQQANRRVEFALLPLRSAVLENME